mmetsp:Transcript_3595/g.11800  ORF Transcript_3595/g.11800 Transcript_3595/m.11800 type:complete len:288 (+) Transcript_3595:1677-2540(+)
MLLLRGMVVFFFFFLAPFGLGAVVDGGGDDVPACVGVGEGASPGRGGGREGEHDWREGGELVVDVSGLPRVSRLERYLETAGAHAVGHGVEAADVCPLLLGVRRHEAGHLRLDGVAPPARPDVSRERGETGVRMDDRIWDRRALAALAGNRVPMMIPLVCAVNPEVVADAEAGEIHHRRTDLVVVQRRQEPSSSQPHVPFHAAEVRRVARVGPRGRRLDHPRPVLRVPLAAFRSVRVSRLAFFELVSNLRPSQRQPRFLVVDAQDGVLDLVAPQELVVPPQLLALLP